MKLETWIGQWMANNKPVDKVKGMHVIGECEFCRNAGDCIIEGFFREEFGIKSAKGMGCNNWEAKE